MDSKFQPSLFEKPLYDGWEKTILAHERRGRPYTILMPPPNANASLHAGHGMYVIDDLMIRYKLMTGWAALWVPGMDHAGFETQYVYEKNLAKQGKSRLDFDRQTLFANIYQFVKDNSGLIYQQFKRLGFLAQWSRSVFTLDQPVLDAVFATFVKMEQEKYVYRSDYIVNYCTHCGTSLSELEVDHVERTDPLYYIKYGPFVLATVRPETKFGDTALAVHPRDKRYQKWVGKEIEAAGLLGKFRIKVIADTYVDPEFGTGVVKITPAHDHNDFAVGQRHHLEIKSVIDFSGRLNHRAGPYAGLKVKQARGRVADDLKRAGLLEKVDEHYQHSVTVCYKCRRDLEPMVVPNWFIKVDKLKQPVLAAVKAKAVEFHPRRYVKQMNQWLKTMHDWPISRQIVWGIRIPAWYNVDQNPDLYVVFLDREKKQQQGTIKRLLQQHDLAEIKAGLQKLMADKAARYVVNVSCPGERFLQETDTFDTWFSSGQWPLVTLKKTEYQTRYPTDMLGTLSDILPFWVSRMMMFSLYLRHQVPFKHVYLWSMVADAQGQKMSKSKGNVINPITLVDRYGADAFRAALIFGTSAGSKVNLAEDRVRGMRNFANKVWNIGRFLNLNTQRTAADDQSKATGAASTKIMKKLEREFNEEKQKYGRAMDSYQFARALGQVYQFIWHRLADYYVEQLKAALQHGNIEVQEKLTAVYLANLQMLHPFMPFVTEAVWQVFKGKHASILNSQF
ncbi:valine--tRNA ligase [Patescibacteria group bacterium]|nr:valine--tRNA ligase [Patescibacteria group bacterium]MCL5091388.1 valine--tRNA ligase [Patescibacteria group bacterium]